VSCCVFPGFHFNHWHAAITSTLVCTCLLPPTPFILSVNRVHFAGEQCSESCKHSIQSKTIWHSFHFLHSRIPNYIGAFFPFFYWSDQFYPFSYIHSFLPLYEQPSLSVLNIPSGLPSKAPILMIALARPGISISRPSMHWLIKNWTTTRGQ